MGRWIDWIDGLIKMQDGQWRVLKVYEGEREALFFRLNYNQRDGA